MGKRDLSFWCYNPKRPIVCYNSDQNLELVRLNIVALVKDPVFAL